MKYGLLRPDGSLTDIQGKPHIGREAEGVAVDVLTVDAAAVGQPMAYDALRKIAILNTAGRAVVDDRIATAQLTASQLEIAKAELASNLASDLILLGSDPTSQNIAAAVGRILRVLAPSHGIPIPP